jgi:hypothetical protein
MLAIGGLTVIIKQISTRIDEQDAKDLKAYLAKEGKSIQDFLKEHIYAYLDEKRKHEKPL